MTVSTQLTKRIYAGNGLTRAWDVDFPLISAQDIHVFITSPEGVEQEVTSDYELNTSLTTLTYPTVTSGRDPLGTGWKITLVRRTPFTQGIDFLRQGELDAEVLEQGYDKLTMLAQELSEEADRCLKYPVSASTPQPTALTAGQLSALNSGITSGLVSQIGTNQANITLLQEGKLDTAQAGQLYLLKEDASDTYVSQTTAAGTYLSKTDAATTYLAKTDAASTYLTQNNANSTYLTQSNAASTYLTQSDANSTYLTQSNAASTYATQSALTSGLAAKQDTLSTAQLAAANSGVTTSTVAQVQTNQEDIAAIDAELDENRPWQKPAGWIDIRSAALPNSVYFLVGHSADYQTYPTFSVRAEVSNSGTYDVYVDGVKKATTASGSGTTLDWATLNLTSGYDVTTPTSLKTHIVRVTPSTSSNTLSAIRTQNVGGVHYASGLLWVHFTTSDFINISYLAGEAGYGRKSEVLACITTNQESLRVSDLTCAFSQSPSLEYVPVLEGNNTEVYITYIAYDCPHIKKIELKNIQNTSRASEPFYGCHRLKEIKTENCQLIYTPSQFNECRLLKRIPDGFIANAEEGLDFQNMFIECTSLEPFSLDFTSARKAVWFTVGGTSSARVDGLKGLTVSNEAPFSYAGSPQLDVSYSGLNRAALVNLFNSMPTVTDGQVCSVVGTVGAADLTAADLAIATGKGWTVTR